MCIIHICSVGSDLVTPHIKMQSVSTAGNLGGTITSSPHGGSKHSKQVDAVVEVRALPLSTEIIADLIPDDNRDVSRTLTKLFLWKPTKP